MNCVYIYIAYSSSSIPCLIYPYPVDAVMQDVNLEATSGAVLGFMLIRVNFQACTEQNLYQAITPTFMFSIKPL